MIKLLRKPAFVFFLSATIIISVLSLIPINLFDGEVVLNYGGVQRIEPAKLSLSYFIGLGYSDADMENVETFYLKPTGYLLVFLLTVALPLLIAYRVRLSNENRERSERIDL